MHKIRIFFTFIVLLGLSVSINAQKQDTKSKQPAIDPRAQYGPCYVDANNNGICDYLESGQCICVPLRQGLMYGPGNRQGLMLGPGNRPGLMFGPGNRQGLMLGQGARQGLFLGPGYYRQGYISEPAAQDSIAPVYRQGVCRFGMGRGVGRGGMGRGFGPGGRGMGRFY